MSRDGDAGEWIARNITELHDKLEERAARFAEQVRAARVRQKPDEDDQTAGRCPPLHLVPREDAWVVVSQGSRRALATADTRHAAHEAAQELASARGTYLFIHRQDGRVHGVEDHRPG